MRIKIKDPYLAQHHFTMLIWGILAGLALTATAAAVYFAGGMLRAWQALGDTTHIFCEGDTLCSLSFTALFKLAPLACVGFFVFSLWEKYTKFRSPLPGTYFTHITFGPDGVLLEKPNPAQNVFFPYEETSLRVTVFAQLYHVKETPRIHTWNMSLTAPHTAYHVKGTPRIHIWNIEFALTQQNGPRQTIQLLPPRRVLPFLCKILDKRTRFCEFSYEVSPQSNPQAAQLVLNKLNSYVQTGFISVFDSKKHRLICLLVGIVYAAGTVWAACSSDSEFFFLGGFFILAPLAAWLLWQTLKDAYLERRARRK